MSAFTSSSDRWDLLDIDIVLPTSGHANAQSLGLKESKNFTYSLESPNFVHAYRGTAQGSQWTNHDYDLFLDLNGNGLFLRRGTVCVGPLLRKDRNFAVRWGRSSREINT